MSRSDMFLTAFIIGWLALAGMFWYKKLYSMSLLWLGIAALVGIMEAASYMYVGRTVTQLFEDLVRRDPGTGWTLLVGMQVVWAFLLIHLAP